MEWRWKAVRNRLVVQKSGCVSWRGLDAAGRGRGRRWRMADGGWRVFSVVRRDSARQREACRIAIEPSWRQAAERQNSIRRPMGILLAAMFAFLTFDCAELRGSRESGFFGASSKPPRSPVVLGSTLVNTIGARPSE
ncbi:hypothetical protein N431DRAFT_443127 [Stipitochalara longipes BDJ]|nr:hypothetical protein N431DRAFT_443127 [Stipitochalara longipes BDJ]